MAPDPCKITDFRCGLRPAERQSSSLASTRPRRSGTRKGSAISDIRLRWAARRAQLSEDPGIGRRVSPFQPNRERTMTSTVTWHCDRPLVAMRREVLRPIRIEVFNSTAKASPAHGPRFGRTQHAPPHRSAKPSYECCSSPASGAASSLLTNVAPRQSLTSFRTQWPAKEAGDPFG